MERKLLAKMSHEHTLIYLKLRKQGKIGKLWVESDCYKLAPVEALAGLEWRLAEDISEQRLLDKMSDLIGWNVRFSEPIVERKPFVREERQEITFERKLTG